MYPAPKSHHRRFNNEISNGGGLRPFNLFLNKNFFTQEIRLTRLISIVSKPILIVVVVVVIDVVFVKKC